MISPKKTTLPVFIDHDLNERLKAIALKWSAPAPSRGKLAEHVIRQFVEKWEKENVK